MAETVHYESGKNLLRSAPKTLWSKALGESVERSRGRWREMKREMESKEIKES